MEIFLVPKRTHSAWMNRLLEIIHVHAKTITVHQKYPIQPRLYYWLRHLPLHPLHNVGADFITMERLSFVRIFRFWDILVNLVSC